MNFARGTKIHYLTKVLVSWQIKPRPSALALMMGWLKLLIRLQSQCTGDHCQHGLIL